MHSTVSQLVICVQPSFHEDYYTTSLDMSNSRISPAAALRLAKQIESDNRNRSFGGSGNAHLDEERGFMGDDDLEVHPTACPCLRILQSDCDPQCL